MLHGRIALFVGAAALAIAACSSGGGNQGFGGGGGDNGGSSGGSSGGGGSGSGSSSGSFGDGGSSGDAPGCNTTVSGTVYDPAGKTPLYDVAVYVPTVPLDPLPTGATCDTCASLYSGKPVAAALTDASGKFVMNGVPPGTAVPLVIQVGKWRRQLVVPTVTACQDNPVPDKQLTLPNNHNDGDIPNIAIATGNADTIECLLRRIGVDASEYEPGASGPGRIHIYTTNPGIFSGPGPNTNPPGPDATQALWDTSAHLIAYDIVLLSCEGTDLGVNPNQQALVDYANAGGRVFASHFHYLWFDSGPFGGANLASWSTGSNGIGTVDAQIVTTLPNGQPFPKGLAMQQWLGNVGALQNGLLPIVDAKHNADVSNANTNSQAWITVSPQSETQYFSFDTPIGQPSDKQCGRVVFSDLHVGAASNDYGGSIGSGTTPSGCGQANLSPQEKALEFMLFDLATCVTPNDQPPVPPHVQ
jgi:hypothetical protein